MKSAKSGIYKITLRGRIYVGSAINLKTRWRAHRNDLARGKHHSRLMQRTYDKYGPDDLKCEVIELVGGGTEELLAREQYWLDLLRPFDGGYNTCIKAGSVFGLRHSEESRARMSETRKGIGAGKTISDEQRKKISAALTGRKHSEERRTRTSLAHLGIRQTPESRARISAAMKGVPKSAETRLRMSLAQKKSRAARGRGK